MAKQRHNLTTIAEVLIDKVESVEGFARQIEETTGKPLKIDLQELPEQMLQLKRELLAHTERTEEIERLINERLEQYLEEQTGKYSQTTFNILMIAIMILAFTCLILIFKLV